MKTIKTARMWALLLVLCCWLVSPALAHNPVILPGDSDVPGEGEGSGPKKPLPPEGPVTELGRPKSPSAEDFPEWWGPELGVLPGEVGRVGYNIYRAPTYADHADRLAQNSQYNSRLYPVFVQYSPLYHIIGGDVFTTTVEAQSAGVAGQVTYGLKLPPQGMTIDTRTGAIRWPSPPVRTVQVMDVEIFAFPSFVAPSLLGIHTARMVIRIIVSPRGAVFYVSTQNGNNTNDGSSPAKAFKTISHAITKANAYDTILVQAGTYAESLDFAGKDLALRSLVGEALTILAPPPGQRAFNFSNKETAAAQVEGFTLRGARLGTAEGGAILIQGASPSFMDCIFEDNRAAKGGGAALKALANPAFMRCRFLGNQATSTGGAIHADASSTPILRNNEMKNNQGGQGGAVHLSPVGLP